MLTSDGPKVLEYNCRFGDPETQALLPLLSSDLYLVLRACCDYGGLSSEDVSWTPGLSSCTVVLASGGYPGNFSVGKVVTGLEEAGRVQDAFVFHAGTKAAQAEGDGGAAVLTSGGRVMAVTGVGRSITAARDVAYKAAACVTFEGKQFRSDIAHRFVV